MSPDTMPTYEVVSNNFAFPVPHSYYNLLRLAFELHPDDPWNVFDAFDVVGLGNTHANPAYVYPGHDYASTPVEVYVFGWSGTDGGHYGFVVDDLPTYAQELPIVEVYPVDGECRLLGMSVADFLSVRIGESVRDYGEEWRNQHFELLMSLSDHISGKDVDEILIDAILQRAQDGAVFTTNDRCGAKIPMHLVDWEFWTRIDWEAVRYENKMPMHLLDEAELRLAKGDYVTAFLIAKNLWMYYWQRTPSGDVCEWVRRIGGVMEPAYRILKRPHLSDKLRAVLDWVLREIV